MSRATTVTLNGTPGSVAARYATVNPITPAPSTTKCLWEVSISAMLDDRNSLEKWEVRSRCDRSVDKIRYRINGGTVQHMWEQSIINGEAKAVQSTAQPGASITEVCNVDQGWSLADKSAPQCNFSQLHVAGAIVACYKQSTQTCV